MPDGVGVSSVLNDQKLKLMFNALLVFDLADAKLAAPANIASINQKVESDTSVVEISLIGDVDVHSFREDKNYIVDVAFQQAGKAAAAMPAARCLTCSGACRAGAGLPAAEKPARRLRRAAPARSCRRVGAIARQADIEIKPERAAENIARIRSADGRATAQGRPREKVQRRRRD